MQGHSGTTTGSLQRHDERAAEQTAAPSQPNTERNGAVGGDLEHTFPRSSNAGFPIRRSRSPRRGQRPDGAYGSTRPTTYHRRVEVGRGGPFETADRIGSWSCGSVGRETSQQQPCPRVRPPPLMVGLHSGHGQLSISPDTKPLSEG